MINEILFKRDTTGGVRIWCLETSSERYRTISGTHGGNQATSGWNTATPKNVGRSNETTPVEQANIEVKAEYQKKLDRGYFRNINDIDKVIFTKPMLAQSWDDLKEKHEKGFAQPKLDGIRCVARADGLWTRSGKKINSVPHIIKALAPIFAREPDLILDGELYNHDYRDDFNSITSAVRKDAPGDNMDIIQYHIYDQVDTSLGFDDRTLGNLGTMFYQVYSPDLPDCLKLVETVKFKSLEQLDELYGRWLTEGYEGQMIRIDEPYETGKRSKTLLKRKDFLTEEFPVVVVEEGNGNWAGVAKKFRLKLPDGREFGAGVRGNKAKLKDLIQQKVHPTWATARFFTPTPDGIPRFPVVIDWGIGKRED